MPVTYPPMSVRNFIPTSIALGSAADAVAGTAVGSNSEALLITLVVVNDQESAAGIEFPAESVTPLSVAVYDALRARSEFGLNVTVRVAALYVTWPATVLFAASR